MKSAQREKYDQLATALILSEPLISKKAIVLEYFKAESDYYYDLFCDKIYEFLNVHYVRKQLEGVVHITDNPSFDQTEVSMFMGTYGRVYVCTEASNPHQLKFRVLSSADVNPEIDDIIYYIDLALERLENYLTNLSQAEITSKKNQSNRH